MLTKFVSIGSYSHEVHTFGTPIMSTKLFSLIKSAKLFDHVPKKILYIAILDSVPVGAMAGELQEDAA